MLEVATGSTVHWVRPGSVEFHNEGDYDVTIGFEVEWGDVPNFTVSRVEYQKRAGGRPITSRGLQRSSPGDFVERAFLMLCATNRGGEHVLHRDAEVTPELRRVLNRAPGAKRPRRLPDDELRFVANEYRNAAPREKERTVADAFRAKYYSVGDEAIRYRLKQARRRIDPETGAPFLGP